MLTSHRDEPLCMDCKEQLYSMREIVSGYCENCICLECREAPRTPDYKEFCGPLCKSKFAYGFSEDDFDLSR